MRKSIWNKTSVILLGSLWYALSLTKAFAQEENYVLPDGFGINQLQTTENLSSGVLNINLPIESYLIPISISHTTSGMRLEQEESVVGLGWNLNAGGFIARQKRGVADDEANGYSGVDQRGKYVNINNTGLDTSEEYIFYQQNGQHIENEKWDKHPDLYSFQFLNKSGVFTLDKNRSVVKLSQSDCKIIPAFSESSGLYQFTIIDEQGNSYVFGKKESIKVFKDDEEIEDYYSKWYLTSITDYVSGKSIQFFYTSAGTYQTAREFNTEKWYQDVSFEPTTTEITTAYDMQLLSSITYDQSTIDFNYEDHSVDSPRKRLKNIKYIENGATYLTYSFRYKFIVSDEDYAQRLMLSEVRKSTLDLILYQFLYYGEREGEPQLPSKDSRKADHWGYYNGNSQGYGPGAGARLKNTHSIRNSARGYCYANALKRVYDMQGGYTEYDYGIHKDASGDEIGGLRIEKIINGAHDGSVYETKTFDYNNSAVLFANPLYNRNYLDDSKDDIVEQYQDQSYNSLFDHMGRHISYGKVTVTHLNESKSEYNFYTMADDASIFSSRSRTGLRVDWSEKEGLSYNYTKNSQSYSSSLPGPFGFSHYYGSATGLLKSTIQYDADGNKLSEQVNSYNPIIGSTFVLGMNTNLIHFDDKSSGGTTEWEYVYNVDFYKLIKGYMELDKSTSTLYDLNDNSKKMTTVTEYDYHPVYTTLPTKITSYPLGDLSSAQIQEIQYLIDDAGTFTEVVDDHLVSLVKEKSSQVNNGQTIAAATVVAYEKNTTDKVIVSGESAYSGSAASGHLMSDVSYLYDNDHDIIVEVEDKMSNQFNSTIWDDTGQHALAQIENARLEDCAYTSFEDDDSGNWSLPEMVSDSECGYTDDCVEQCGQSNNTCINNCIADQDDCRQNLVNLKSGVMGYTAYDLGNGNITKSLRANLDYLLRYWLKDGTVALTGLNSNEEIRQRSLDGWTFYERKVSRTSDGNLTISGSATIDHLSIHPVTASMRTITRHKIFGKTSDTGPNANSVFYEYDDAGRQVLVRDKNKHILQANDYKITQYISSVPSLKTDYAPKSKSFYVHSNGSWSISESCSWYSVTTDDVSGFGLVTLNFDERTSSSTRSCPLTINGDGVSKEIAVSQTGAPSGVDYLRATPVGLNQQGRHTITVTTNTSWVAEYAYSSDFLDIDLYAAGSNTATTTVNGTGSGSFDISAFRSGDNSSTPLTLSGGVIIRSTDGSVSQFLSITIQ